MGTMAAKRKSTLKKFTKKIRGFLHDAVEAPPEPEKPNLIPEEQQTDEPFPDEPAPDSPIPFEPDIPDLPYEPDDTPPEPDSEALDVLNEATQRWKQTGDPGLHLTAPVPLTERAKNIWNKLAHDLSPKLAARLKTNIDAVAARAGKKISEVQASRAAAKNKPANPAPITPSLQLKETPSPQSTPTQQTSAQTPKHPPLPAQVDLAIKQSWQEVLSKAEENASPAEREEIEKLYKQLSS
ncbi:hypothetical protein C4580_02585 [Candidatus Woesearchaeota archaeon]|nr:MAG: hypothetical protein C4580_02585 [Candidatus Woesearchaeota archaeon]